MVEVRNIILIGRTGNGKSTLANVLVNETDREGNFIDFKEFFKESERSVSQTRKTDTKEFEEDEVKYRIIDTIGIGDTKLTEQQVLNKIADVAFFVENGLSQILFVTGGRFEEKEIEVYNKLRTVIFDNNIGNFTTIVRTKFPNFRKPERWKEDRLSMINESIKMAEIINSCKKVVYVDNPALDVEDEDEINVSLKKRKESRKILLTHLRGCQNIYKPTNLDKLNERVGSFVSEKEQIKKLLEDKSLSEAERKRFEKRISYLEKEVAENTRGFFETLTSLPGRAVDNTFKAVVEVGKNCKIM